MSSSISSSTMSLQMQTSTTVFRNSAPSTASQRLLPLRTVAVRQETSSSWRGVRCSGVGDAWKQKAVPNSNYVVPMDDKFSSSSSITRPLIEILRDLNKKIPDNIVKSHGPGSNAASSGFIPWYSLLNLVLLVVASCLIWVLGLVSFVRYHANRMLSFYAPGWCGEVRDVIYSENGSVVTVVYRLTIRGSDGEVISNTWLQSFFFFVFLSLSVCQH